MIVALLTDFGLSDPYVGVMKAIVLHLAPNAAVIDLTHAIAPQAIAAGAWALWQSYPYLAPETIILAVVDPGVGTIRRPVAVRHTSGRIFVGPDNGLLTRVLPIDPVDHAVMLDQPDYWLAPHPLTAPPIDGAPHSHSPITSQSFHGRDRFAPVAGHLAAGVDLAAVGTPVDPATLVRLPVPTPEHDGDRLIAHVIAIDHFGNLITDIGPDQIAAFFGAASVHAHLGQRHIDLRVATFGDAPPDRPFWYPDSSGHAAVALRDGHAARTLGAIVGTAVSIRLR